MLKTLLKIFSRFLGDFLGCFTARFTDPKNPLSRAVSPKVHLPQKVPVCPTLSTPKPRSLPKRPFQNPSSPVVHTRPPGSPPPLPFPFPGQQRPFQAFSRKKAAPIRPAAKSHSRIFAQKAQEGRSPSKRLPMPPRANTGLPEPLRAIYEHFCGKFCFACGNEGLFGSSKRPSSAQVADSGKTLGLTVRPCSLLPLEARLRPLTFKTTSDVSEGKHRPSWASESHLWAFLRRVLFCMGQIRAFWGGEGPSARVRGTGWGRLGRTGASGNV